MPAVRTLPTSDLSSQHRLCLLPVASVHARPSRWTEWLVGFLAPRPPLPPWAVVIQQGPSRALSWAWRRRPADGVLRSPGRAARGESSHPGTKVLRNPRQVLLGPRGVTGRPRGLRGGGCPAREQSSGTGAPFPAGLPGWQ